MTTSPAATFSLYSCFMIAALYFTICRTALIPQLIPSQATLSFNILNERIALIGCMVSPFLIGEAIVYFGRERVLLAAFALYALTFCCLFALPTPQKTQNPQKNAAPSSNPPLRRIALIRDYSETIEQNRNLLPFFMLLMIGLICGGFLNFGLPLFLKDIVKTSIATYGAYMSLFQCGSFLGTLLLPMSLKDRTGIAPKPRRIALHGPFIVMGIGLLTLYFTRNRYGIGLLMLFFGMATTYFHVFIESLIQSRTPPHQSGKIMSLLSIMNGTLFLAVIFFCAGMLNYLEPQHLFLIGVLFMGSAFLGYSRVK